MVVKSNAITIKENEGHGRLDGEIKGPLLQNISICRFRFPKFPLDETKVVRGISKDSDEKLVKSRKSDLNKNSFCLVLHISLTPVFYSKFSPRPPVSV